MNDASALNVRELLLLLAEQQATLVKLLQLVVEHVLSESRPDPPTIDTPVVRTDDPVIAPPVSTVISPTTETVAPSNLDIVSSSEREPVATAPALSPPESGASLLDPPESTPPAPGELPSATAPTVSTDSPFGDASTKEKETGATPATAPVISMPTTVNTRVARYLNRPTSAPVKQVTNQELYRLSRLREVGDVAQLVMNFGEYRGATLFQIAQADPDYLRSLALSAQRPQVRAAAMQLVRALEASEPSPGRRRSTKKISRRDDR
jgi:hypothetical protein